MNKRLSTLIAGLAIAGTASATIVVDEAFNYPDAQFTELSPLSGAGLSGDYFPAWGTLEGAVSGGQATACQNGVAATVVNPTTHAVGDDSELWVSYRYKQNGSGIATGGNVAIGKATYAGAVFGMADAQDDTWQHVVAKVGLGRQSVTSTNVLIDVAVPADKNADLFLVGKVVFSDPPVVSMAVYDWTNKPTVAPTTWELEHTFTNIAPADIDFEYSVLSLTQGDGNPDIAFDNILVGTEFVDVDGVYSTPTAIPTDPTNLVLTAKTSAKIRLEWTDTSLEEEGFYIERSLDGSSYSVVATNARNETAFLDMGLAPNTLYYYRVSAFNGIGSSATISGTETTFEALPPADPSDLSATRTTQIEVGLTWTDNATDETVYVVERKTTGAFEAIAFLDKNETSYADTGLAVGETYIYQVAATNEFGFSGYSAESTVTTTADPVAPSSGLMVSAVETDYVLDFDSDLAGVYMANVGAFTPLNLVEPDHDARNSAIADGGAALFSESISVKYPWTTGVHGSEGGNNTATRFLADGNLNTSTADLIGFQDSAVQGMSDAAGAAGNYSYKLNIVWSPSTFAMRIKNVTGAPVSSWEFAADIFYDATADGYSVMQMAYAVDGSANQDVMVWTDCGSSLTSSVSHAIDTVAGTIGGSFTSAPVPDGGYIVLRIKDVASAGGNTYLDNIKVIAHGTKSPFATWADDYGLTGVKTDDFDNDHMADFYEYALGGDPTDPADTGMVEYGDDGAGFFTYIYGKRTDDGALVYTLVDTPDLVYPMHTTNAWDSKTEGASGVTDFDSVTNKYDMTGKAKQFLELIVE